MRKLVCISHALFFASTCSVAVAQVYSGVSDTGTIVLSTDQLDSSQTLLIEEEKTPTALLPANMAEVNKRVPENIRAYVAEASSAYHLPAPLIHAVISVESNYNPAAVSRKGATGLMQIMPATGRRFGNNNLFDARQNILTGSRYLRWLLDFFQQNVELSVAAYNAGEGAVMQAGWKIPRIPETQRYVPKVMALYEKLQKHS